MGLFRKMASVSTLGVIDFRSDKERIARYTKQTRDATRALVDLHSQPQHEERPTGAFPSRTRKGTPRGSTEEDRASNARADRAWRDRLESDARQITPADEVQPSTWLPGNARPPR